MSNATDWHAADIVAELRKRRLSLRRLSKKNGYADGSLKVALRRAWPKGEYFIATALGKSAMEIWPSRYHVDGSPRQGRPYSPKKTA